MGTHNLKQKWKSTNEHMLKAKENKWVLRRDLKTDKEGAILRRFSLEQGIVNKLRLLDLKLLGGL